VENTAYVT